MKKLIIFILGAFFLTLLLRFVIVEAPQDTRPRPEVACPSFGEPQFDPHGQEIKPLVPSCDVLGEINQAYVDQVKPIFQEKCLMCHGNVSQMPLYSKVPPSSFLVNHDIEEAKESVDMTHDFPFFSRKENKKKPDTQDHFLEEIQEVIEENDMPPLVYKLMHWKSGVTDQEKKIILEWVRESREKLGS